MKKYFVALSVLIFLLVGTCLAFIGKVAASYATSPRQWKVISYPSTYGNGQTFYYLEYVPPGYTDTGNQEDYPVIISLTGLGWHTDGLDFFPDRLKGANLERTIRDGRDYPFIVLTPHLPTEVKGRYNYTGQYPDGVYIKEDSLIWDVNLVDEILEKAKKELRIDESRIYLLGCSMGGGGVWKYLQAHGDKIAAAVSVSGYYTKYGPYDNNPHVNQEEMAKQPVDFACEEKVKSTPIWAFHSADDDFIPPLFTYKAVKAINNCQPPPDPKVRFTMFSEGGHLKIYPRVFEYSTNYSYDLVEDPKKSGGVPVTPYLPTKPFRNDIFAWMLSHQLGTESVNNPPTDLTLSKDSVTESQAIGTLVGTFTTTDPDPDDQHEYTLISGEGSTDNASFKITGDRLLTAAVLDYETKDALSVRVQTSDGQGGVFAKAFTIRVSDTTENNAPTDIALNNDSIAENADIGTLVGELSTTDADATDSHTYTLAAGAGSEDNQSFSITGNQLKAATVFDYEQKPAYALRIRTDDGKGGVLEKAFTVFVKDILEDNNSAPTDIALDNDTIEENQPENALIGTFTTTDADAEDVHTYTLVAGEGSMDNAQFSIQNDQLLSQAVFDFVQKPAYSIRVQTNDGKGGVFAKAFKITIKAKVEETNSTPTDITLSATAVKENAPEGTLVGLLSTTDADVEDTFTYRLAEGEADNASFAIAGDSLKTATVFDYEEKTAYQLLIQTDDNNGGVLEKAFTVDISDLPEDTLSVSTITLPGTQPGEPFSYVIPDSVVAAVAGAGTAYSVSLTGGAPLPVWLTFEADSKTLSGTPAEADTGQVAVQLTAVDDEGNVAIVNIDLTIETVTAIGDDRSQAIRVYPVPVQDGKVYIDFGEVPQEAVEILVLTLTGQLVKSVRFGRVSQVALDLSRLSTGTYIIEIKSKTLRYRDKLLVP